MNHTDKITALRDALTDIFKRSMESNIAHIAKDALALTADASEDAPLDKSMQTARFVYKGMPMAIQALDYLQALIDNPLPDMAPAARPAPVGATPAPAARREIFAICDAYESGIGHGLQLDGHKSGAIFGNPECGKAYEIGYEEGEERARGGKAAAPAAPIAKEAAPKLAEVIAFLNGEGPLDGMHFGDSDTARPRGRYWWRKHLMAAWQGQQAGVVDGEAS